MIHHSYSICRRLRGAKARLGGQRGERRTFLCLRRRK
jgi:hypothetical protein